MPNPEFEPPIIEQSEAHKEEQKQFSILLSRIQHTESFGDLIVFVAEAEELGFVRKLNEEEKDDMDHEMENLNNSIAHIESNPEADKAKLVHLRVTKSGLEDARFTFGREDYVPASYIMPSKFLHRGRGGKDISTKENRMRRGREMAILSGLLKLRKKISRSAKNVKAIDEALNAETGVGDQKPRIGESIGQEESEDKIIGEVKKESAIKVGKPSLTEFFRGIPTKKKPLKFLLPVKRTITLEGQHGSPPRKRSFKGFLALIMSVTPEGDKRLNIFIQHGGGNLSEYFGRNIAHSARDISEFPSLIREIIEEELVKEKEGK